MINIVDQLIELCNLEESPTQLELCCGVRSLRMLNTQCPISISEREGWGFNHYITTYNLKNGYEIATAFGVSAITAGIGFAKTGGRLVTMDAYVEEKYRSPYGYGETIEKYENAVGYKLTQYLINKLDLEDVVFPKVGWSPNDTETALSSVFNLRFEKLDYVFIDAQHTDRALQNDILSILPFLNRDRFILLMHDMWGSYPKACEMMKREFNRSHVFMDCIGHGMAYITNLDDILEEEKMFLSKRVEDFEIEKVFD